MTRRGIKDPRNRPPTSVLDDPSSGPAEALPETQTLCQRRSPVRDISKAKLEWNPFISLGYQEAMGGGNRIYNATTISILLLMKSDRKKIMKDYLSCFSGAPVFAFALVVISWLPPQTLQPSIKGQHTHPLLCSSHTPLRPPPLTTGPPTAFTQIFLGISQQQPQDSLSPSLIFAAAATAAAAQGVTVESICQCEECRNQCQGVPDVEYDVSVFPRVESEEKSDI
ncbi:hypothetical protein H920_10719 [Fukomys damarensis]|uniref:Uncharacterized protein n=1 Tax=Fukomys damarensis TaxID=885580 RepID=A0A091DBH6_FUKDA|nr:hypothetical protein H920_10719 [Fukomys damarensis]